MSKPLKKKGRPASQKLPNRERATKTLPKSSPKASGGQQAIQEFWSAEVSSLSRTVFHTIEEAAHALIDRVLARLQLSEHESKELREFLILLLETDEDAREELAHCVTIKK